MTAFSLSLCISYIPIILKCIEAIVLLQVLTVPIPFPVRLVTSAGWNDVLEPLLVTPPDCDPDFKGLPNGNCGHPFVAIVYFVSFIIINFMIVINMYIAIILENFNQAHQEEEIGIVEEDLEMFYTKWSK